MHGTLHSLCYFHRDFIHSLASLCIYLAADYNDDDWVCRFCVKVMFDAHLFKVLNFCVTRSRTCIHISNCSSSDKTYWHAITYEIIDNAVAVKRWRLFTQRRKFREFINWQLSLLTFRIKSFYSFPQLQQLAADPIIKFAVNLLHNLDDDDDD